jgi:hypothetical protein
MSVEEGDWKILQGRGPTRKSLQYFIFKVEYACTVKNGKIYGLDSALKGI